MINGLTENEWHFMYFAGVSEVSPEQLTISQNQLCGLLSVLDIHSGIGCGAAINPLYLYNEKKATPWHAAFALIFSHQKTALTKAANCNALLYIPPDYFHKSFHTHINWPNEAIRKYDLHLENKYLFLIPFMVHANIPAIANLAQPLKTADELFEIYGAYEFIEEEADKLLAEFAQIAHQQKQC